MQLIKTEPKDYIEKIRRNLQKEIPFKKTFRFCFRFQKRRVIEKDGRRGRKFLKSEKLNASSVTTVTLRTCVVAMYMTEMGIRRKSELRCELERLIKERGEVEGISDYLESKMIERVLGREEKIYVYRAMKELLSTNRDVLGWL